jgi:hypothetical protein
VWRDNPRLEGRTPYSSKEEGNRGGAGDEDGYEGETWLVDVGTRGSDSNVRAEVKVEVKVKGRGKVRGLLFWREDGGKWIGRDEKPEHAELV